MKRSNPLLLALVLVLASLACNFSQASGDQPEGEAEQADSATVIPPTEALPTATTPVERVQLDPCQLLSEEEASELLGGQAAITPGAGFGACVYGRQTDDPAAMQQLAVGAAQGEEAKSFGVVSLGLMAGFSGDPTLMADFEALNEQLPDLSLGEVVNQMALVFRDTPLEVMQADGPAGESLLWLAYSDEFFSQGTLLVARGEEYVSLSLIGGDLGGGQEKLSAWVNLVFDRLPEAFYVLDEDADGDFSFEFSTEVDLGEDEQPEPTPEVVSGLVWVASPNGGRLFAIDPMANEVIADIDVGRFPSDIAVADGKVWVVSETEGAVSRIDPETFEVVEVISLGGQTHNVAANGDQVWVSGGLGVRAIDLVTGTRSGVEYHPAYDVVIGEDAIWVSLSQDEQILKIDPSTKAIVATAKLEGRPTEMAYGHGLVWVILYEKKELVGIDPETLLITTAASNGQIIHDVTIGPDRVWYSGPFTIDYLDAALTGGGSIEAPNPATELAYYAGSLWIVSANEGIVTRLNPDTLTVIAEIDLGVDLHAIAAGE